MSRASKPTRDAKRTRPLSMASLADSLPPASEKAARNPSRKRPDPPMAQTQAPPAKKVKAASSGRPRAAGKLKHVINAAPTDALDVFVFGSNSQAELGLGGDVDSRAVMRPRLNPNLASDSVGVVQLAAGGQHCVALTKGSGVLTWGANDLWALGRDTTWSGGTVDVDAMEEGSSDDDDDEGGELNPKEATPTEVDASFPEGTVLTQVAASDNASFAVTDEGLVFGWGTFRDSQGTNSFSLGVDVQKGPCQIPGVSKVTKIATGTNHILALTADGAVFAWGNSDQDQLGRRISERHKANGLVPTRVKLPKDIIDIGAGSYHSFAVHKSGTVYSWGANNFGQTGHAQGLGEANTSVIVPAAVKGLEQHGAVSSIAGGEHHSIAVTTNGACLVWGRLDGSQTGLEVAKLPEKDLVRDEYGRARILKAAAQVPGLKAVRVDAGIDCCVVITTDGQAYSWGFSESYRTGLGTDDDVELPRLVQGKAVKDRTLVAARLGGQFGVVAAKRTGTAS